MVVKVIGTFQRGANCYNQYMNTLDLKSNAGFTGSYIIRKWCSITGKLLWESPVITNKVVASTGYGLNIIIQQLGNVTIYPIAIDSAKIGTGTSTPVDGDTDLQTPTVTTGTGWIVADRTINNKSVTISFFIASGDLPNNTYKEFGIFCSSRLFARSLITPNFIKGSNQNVTVDYTITGTN